MKTLEKLTGINVNDLKQVGPALFEVKDRLLKDYEESVHPKLRILDSLILFCLVSFVIQFGYVVCMGKDPFNSFLSGIFCSLGQFALAASLRIQISNSEFQDYSNKKAFSEFLLGSFLLYLSCLCLVG